MEPETTTGTTVPESKPVWGYMLAVLLVVILVVFFYFWSQRSTEAPEPEAPVYTEAEREEILNSLRAPSVEEISVEERTEAMQSLRAPSESEISVTERQQILDSLKAR